MVEAEDLLAQELEDVGQLETMVDLVSELVQEAVEDHQVLVRMLFLDVVVMEEQVYVFLVFIQEHLSLQLAVVEVVMVEVQEELHQMVEEQDHQVLQQVMQELQTLAVVEVVVELLVLGVEEQAVQES